jgi:hypothetical protein
MAHGFILTCQFVINNLIMLDLFYGMNPFDCSYHNRYDLGSQLQGYSMEPAT